MYIAYDLFIVLPILRSTLNKLETTHCCNMYFKYTLLADIFHSSSQLILKELTFLCNLFSFLQEVLGSSLHRCRQNMSLLGASFLFVRWAFVAGVYQCSDLWQGYKIIEQSGFNTLDVFGRLQVMPTALFTHETYGTTVLAFQHFLFFTGLTPTYWLNVLTE